MNFDSRFRWVGGLILSFLFLICTKVPVQAQSLEKSKEQIDMEWPEINYRQKPWTRWWWMGNAVDKENITWHLEQLNEKGVGGVEITPIYGVEGYEDVFIDFLSPKWMEMLQHTLDEADRLGMKVDLILGTGWPYGGPWISKEDAARNVAIQKYELNEGEHLQHRVEHVNRQFEKEAPLHALMAYSSNGKHLNLTDKVDDTGRLKWTAPSGDWNLVAFFGDWTTQQVKRSAPGGEGNVMDHFSGRATQHYLKRFEEAFSGYDTRNIRAFFNDSYEVYGADWTYDLFEQFEQYQGYDLKTYLPAFMGLDSYQATDLVSNLTSEEVERRVRSDFYETLHHLAFDRFAKPWVEWTHAQGSRSKNQAHGFPGNILDFYGVADIPEMEIFGQREFNIPEMRQNKYLTNLTRAPDPLILKFASSAAHVEGKTLTSSETATWLDEHFRVALSQVKPHVDMQMVAGVNHMIYHGMTYSPKEEEWPGWLFYASTNFAPSNTFWRDFGALNSYLATSQSFLQQGKQANDILLYFPIYDLWHRSPEGGPSEAKSWTVDNNLFQIAVGNPDTWFYDTPFENLASYLWDRGYTFDYISDRQLKETEVNGSRVVTFGDASYKTVVVPPVNHMPLETLQHLVEIAREGGTVIFEDELPATVPGLNNLTTRLRKLDQITGELDFNRSGKHGILEARVGVGRILTGENVQYLLDEVGVRREPFVDTGIDFIRRHHDEGYFYFLTNLYGQAVDQWVSVGTPAESAIIFDPLNRRRGKAEVRKTGEGRSEIRIQLKPGESVVVKTFETKNIRGDAWPYAQQKGRAYALNGRWTIQFGEGGPVTPQDITTGELASWTVLGGADAKRFSGTATYTLKFEKPKTSADAWLLDLGEVAESAEVKINGNSVGTLWSHPFEIRIYDELLRNKENVLEVIVTNLMANRIADMDRRNIQWRKFYDINLVNLDYEPFDAAGWEPMDSGLLGPVELTPLDVTE